MPVIDPRFVTPSADHDVASAPGHAECGGTDAFADVPRVVVGSGRLSPFP
jgi:hypothetical protein